MYSVAERNVGSNPFSSCGAMYHFAEPWVSGLAAGRVAGGAASQTCCPSCGSSLQLESPLACLCAQGDPGGPALLCQVWAVHWGNGECRAASLAMPGSFARQGNTCLLICLAGDTGFCFHSRNVQNSSRKGVRQPPMPAFLSAESALTMLVSRELAERSRCLRLFPNTTG